MPSLKHWAAVLYALQSAVDARCVVQTLDRRQLVNPVGPSASAALESLFSGDRKLPNSHRKNGKEDSSITKSPEHIEKGISIARGKAETTGDHSVQDVVEKKRQRRLESGNDPEKMDETLRFPSARYTTVNVTFTPVVTDIITTTRTTTVTEPGVQTFTAWITPTGSTAVRPTIAIGDLPEHFEVSNGVAIVQETVMKTIALTRSTVTVKHVSTLSRATTSAGLSKPVTKDESQRLMQSLLSNGVSIPISTVTESVHVALTHSTVTVKPISAISRAKSSASNSKAVEEPSETGKSVPTQPAVRAHLTIDGFVYDVTTLPPGRYQAFSRVVLGAADAQKSATTSRISATTTAAARGQASGAQNHGPVLKVFSTKTIRIVKASGTSSSTATATVLPLQPGDSIAHTFRIRTHVYYGDVKFDNLTIQNPSDLSSPTVPQLSPHAQTAATFYLDPSTASIALTCSKSRANLGLVMIRDRDQDAYGSVVLGREVGTARIGFARSDGVEAPSDSLEKIVWDNDRFGSWLACQLPVSGKVELRWWDVVSNRGIDEKACAKVELVGERITERDVTSEC